MWIKESFQINGKKTLLEKKFDSIDSSKKIPNEENQDANLEFL